MILKILLNFNVIITESNGWVGWATYPQEILDCSMPMSFDTYSVCSYNCLYCFSFFQKSHCVRGYNEKEVRSVDPEKVKNIF